MPATTTVTNKREALLNAACELIAERGLHNTPTSAIAKKAGVAAGTLFLYFKNKEELINELYLHIKRQALAYFDEQVQVPASSPEWFRAFWFAIAHWHLNYPKSFSVTQQCEAAGILTPETIQADNVLAAAPLSKYQTAIDSGLVKDLPRQVIYAIMIGPLAILSHIHAKGEIEVTDEVLQLTYEQLLDGIRP